MKSALIAILQLLLFFNSFGQIYRNADALKFSQIPTRWDEGLPLGNGLIGELIWQKDDKLRFSLDHAELWDLRPMKELHTPNFNYKWVKEQVLKDNYAAVQKIGDIPYEREPAPSKLPGAALEFDIKSWGAVKYAKLNIEKAISEIVWENGAKMNSFVNANKSIGYFRFENVDAVNFKLVPPKYEGEIDKSAGGSVAGDDLARLGYKQGKVTQSGNSYRYIQRGWGGFYYEVAVKWKQISPKIVEGSWAISAHYPNKPKPTATQTLTNAENYQSAFNNHQNWWKAFWDKSSITLPDSTLEKQYYLELYKFGSVARSNTPPISLQAVWTADNGRLPPWKGDFHHDLNTQLSYWPSYSSNHLEEALGYLNHLDQNKARYKKYTKWYFGTDGLNVPGVTTLTGEEMGGWIQYSLSPTVSAWLSQHYYWQWRYSMDKEFLQKRAYPWFRDVAKHLEQITYLDKNGKRQLPLSSSPEINDNSKSAWFLENTNYDLALMRYVFEKATELANELGLKAEAERYGKILLQFSDYHLSQNAELNFSVELPYNQSHRHFSHLMAIHPLGEIRWENGERDQKIIQNTIQQLDKIGPANWCGYSYSWLGNLKTRAKDGEGAARALKDFAMAFCSVNSFHLNGDQTKSGKSNFTYRPFTLEGNFAYAAGIQEMLLQSHAGQIEVFPAIPKSWQRVSFSSLRAEGAFLVSAKQEGGLVDEIRIYAEQGGKTRVKLPFKTHVIRSQSGIKIENIGDNILEITFPKGSQIVINNGYE
ncbi:MAG: glycosyl hydrolase family 95 catalytic domain-containing protein [Spirosomataceae bacterium]